MGHLGATAGSLTAPTGPAVDLADAPGIQRLDAVVADHTDQQALSFRPNGVLLTENRSKGLRFTRLRLVADPDQNKVVYKTADFHRPWNIGVTPDPAIQARINQLNAQLAPILGTADRNVGRGRASRRQVRTTRRASVRVAGRQRRHRRDEDDLPDRLRVDELGRPAC